MCLFCDIINDKKKKIQVEDTILNRGEYFYTKPALGSFIEGYILINSIKHVDSFRDLSKLELENFTEYLQVEIAKTKLIYGDDVVFFEHGQLNKSCDKKKECIGRCIPHAHMHLIPTPIFPIKYLKDNFNWICISNLIEIKSVKYKSYLLVSNQPNSFYVFETDERVKSQYLRKLLCSYTEDKDNWNWVYSPYRENIQMYIEKRKNAVEH